MSEDRCVICGAYVPEGRMICPECEKRPMKNLSHGEMVQIAEGKKNKMPRYIDANKLIDLANHEGAYGYVDIHDIYNAPTADVVERNKGWIPCSEKLPEVRQWVLCQCRAGIMDVLRLTADGSWSKNYPRTKYMSCFVVAWMPLPEPYQSSIEENTDG